MKRRRPDFYGVALEQRALEEQNAAARLAPEGKLQGHKGVLYSEASENQLRIARNYLKQAAAHQRSAAAERNDWEWNCIW